jgi:hypothetical protein
MAVPLMFLLDIGWDVVEDARGTTAMLLFILEESCQTAMMGEYLAVKEELWADAMHLNLWIRQYLSGQLLAFADSAWSAAAYPLNNAYYLFAASTNKTLDIYTATVHKHLLAGE